MSKLQANQCDYRTTPIVKCQMSLQLRVLLVAHLLIAHSGNGVKLIRLLQQLLYHEATGTTACTCHDYLHE